MFTQGGKYTQDRCPRTVRAWGYGGRGGRPMRPEVDEGSGSGWRVAGTEHPK